METENELSSTLTSINPSLSLLAVQPRRWRRQDGDVLRMYNNPFGTTVEVRAYY